LAGNGWSNRRIARELGINRETVGKYLLLARPKPAISTPGSGPDPNSKPAIPISGTEPPPDSKPAISTAGSATGRQSLCQPYSPRIEAAVGVGLSAQRIYQDLVCDHGFTGSYQAIKRFVRHLRETQPIPFVRMEVEPGAEAQVDFGQGAWVVVDGKRKRPHLFPGGLEPFAQGLQRGGLAADHGELHPLPGEQLPRLRRGSQDHGH
jgi:transposase